MIQDKDLLALLEQQDALERALASLDPEDQEILRMKYYQGMTAWEIAASLGLPYETVKKRHQRSVKKLLKALGLGLDIAVLLALLAACTYLALRHFGFVPGYGINTNQEFPIYILEKGVAVDGQEYQIHLEDAYWRDGSLLCDLKLYGDTGTTGKIPDMQLSGLEEAEQPAVSTWGSGVDTLSYRLIWEGQLPENAGDQVELTLMVEGTQVPFVLMASKENSLEEAGFFDLTPEEGGLLAVPRMEKGELVVSIHPLNQGEFATYPFLNEGVWAGYGGPDQPITVTAEDGTVLEGEPGVYSPFSGDSYVDWYFGPAQPGEYTLTVPSLVVTLEGEYHAPVSLPQEEGESLPLESVQLRYGTVVLDTITGLGPGETFPLNSANQVITTTDGAVSAPQKTPLAASLALSLESGGEDYTLLNFGLKLFVTEEAYFLVACERQYQFSETGSQLTGLLLRYTPGLSAIDLIFWTLCIVGTIPFRFR